MRILVLCHEYPPLGGGGGKVAQDLCRGYIKHGHQVRILTARAGDLPIEQNDEGVEVIRLKSLRRHAFKADMRAMMGYIWAAFWAGLKTIRTWKPDVIHVHFAVPAGAVAYALSLFTGVPYVLTAHLGDVPGGVPEKTGQWFKWIFPFTPPIWKKARHIVAVSEFTRQLALAKYPVAIDVIPNGVDLRLLDPGEIVVQEPPVIAFAGRFVPQKDPLQIVRSLAEVSDLPWQAVLIGDGSLRVDIEKEITTFHLEDRFTLPGWLTPEQVIEWFRKSDILFMPSLSEGLPVVGVQALAMGLAMVLSDAGGNPALVKHDVNGMLIVRGHNTEYSQALRTLLSDRQTLYEARLSSRSHAKNFDLDAVVESYEKNLIHAAPGRMK
jgi:glycosyltransferase involved in cell wall biosynthesis